MSADARLLSALEAVAGALEAGDPVAGAQAMDVVVEACEEVRAAGATLDATTLAAAHRLFGRCAAAADTVHTGLVDELAEASRGRRASAAYAR